MRNPYQSPDSRVQDLEGAIPPSWLRLIGSVAISAMIALAASWLVSPLLARALAQTLNLDGSAYPSKALLAGDMVFSSLFVFGCSWLAAKLAGGRTYIAALGVGLIGWTVYFWEVGGLSGMLVSRYPLWYEFFPSHFGSALLAALLVSRQRANFN